MTYRICAFALSAALLASGQEKKIKTGLTPQDWRYKLGDGVTSKEITYYSDGAACYGKIFYPKGFAAAKSKLPGIVLGQGWAGTHFSIEKYAARFAEMGMVAMAIDYRGWGESDGFVSTVDRIRTPDDKRFHYTDAKVVVKRTRLLPLKQVEDYRNAISYLQGEPGVDPERIGIWGSSFAGGHTMTVAALDARVKVVACQIPGIAGKMAQPGPYLLKGPLLEDAIQRARTGQGGEFETGYSTRRMVDVETNQAIAEYRPLHSVPLIGNRPVMWIAAEKDELINNDNAAKAAYDLHTGPKEYHVIPAITHFEAYIGEAFETTSKLAGNWFRKHFGLDGAASGGAR